MITSGISPITYGYTTGGNTAVQILPPATGQTTLNGLNVTGTGGGSPSNWKNIRVVNEGSIGLFISIDGGASWQRCPPGGMEYIEESQTPGPVNVWAMADPAQGNFYGVYARAN